MLLRTSLTSTVEVVKLGRLLVGTTLVVEVDMVLVAEKEVKAVSKAAERP